MRKLKLQVQMTIDGFIAGPDGEMDWMTWNWDNALKLYVNDLTDSIGTILMGSGMSEGFMTYWIDITKKPGDPEYAFAKKMVDTPKVIFSRTMDSTAWPNTTLAKGELAQEVSRLKNQPGKDMIVYGGARFDSSLIKAGLIDEYYLFINPAAIGHGLPIFADLKDKRHFELVESTAFECGVVVMHYRTRG